jgi:LITAF-like zinc ribbon domain
MGFFSKKTKETDPEAPSPNRLVGDDDDLPVATMVTAFPVQSAPPPQPKAPSAPTMMMPPPQQPSYQQHTATATMSNVFLSRAPTLMQPCPCCQQNARTRVVTFPSWVTWTLCIVIFFVFWPLCWIPLTIVKVRKGNVSRCRFIPFQWKCNGRSTLTLFVCLHKWIDAAKPRAIGLKGKAE